MPVPVVVLPPLLDPPLLPPSELPPPELPPSELPPSELPPLLESPLSPELSLEFSDESLLAELSCPLLIPVVLAPSLLLLVTYGNESEPVPS